MPKGPNGQRRPADAVGCAVAVAKIATGESEETSLSSGKIRSGQAGGRARAEKLSPQARQKIARKAANVRWQSK